MASDTEMRDAASTPASFPGRLHRLHAIGPTWLELFCRRAPGGHLASRGVERVPGGTLGGRTVDAIRVAVDAWLELRPLQNPDAPGGPLQMEEYTKPELERAEELQLEAERHFEEGREANQQSADYVLTTVFLAMVRFFAGLATRLGWQPVRPGVLIFALQMLAYGLYRLASFPVV